MKINKYESNVKPFLKQVSLLAMCSGTEEEIADKLDISLKTLHRYKKEHSEFKEALETKKISDIKVMEAFLKRACGYTAKEETTELKGKKDENGEICGEQVVKKTTQKDIPPDLSAIKWWMEKNGDFANAPEEIDIEKARELLEKRRDIIADRKEDE